MRGGARAKGQGLPGCGEALLAVEEQTRPAARLAGLSPHAQAPPAVETTAADGGWEWPSDFEWRRGLRAGDLLDARDRDGKWFEAVIVARGPAADLFASQAQQALDAVTSPRSAALRARYGERVSAGGEAVRVHFRAWSERFDEVKHLELDALALARRFSFTPNWRAKLAAHCHVEVKLAMPTAQPAQPAQAQPAQAHGAVNEAGKGLLW